MNDTNEEELFCPFCDDPVDVLEAQGNPWNTPDFWCSCRDENCAGYHSEPEGQWHTREDAVEAWLKAGRKMTTGRYLEYLTTFAQEYRKGALKSIMRNRHMNDIDPVEIKQFIRKESNERLLWDTIDAVITDLVNFAGVRMGVDYALYSYDVYWPEARDFRRKMDEEKDLLKRVQMEQEWESQLERCRKRPIESRGEER